ncbi:MAG TPA: diacylglycerol kinase family protein [Acidothermaceae bacterium]|jgi:diacylglycerol kinase family enzyme
MRALLVANLNATAMTPRKREVIVRALGSELKIDVAETDSRGHAADLAAQARADQFDLVIAVGGDGTVNEVVTGLLREGVGPDTPRLAVVPGGNANVFARALGLPSEPIEATGAVIERLRAGRERRIGLGRLTTAGLDRWFTFCAGFGLDAEIVREVEQHRLDGAKATPALFMRTGLRQFFRTDRRHPALALETPGQDPVEKVFMTIVTNTTPWTYFGDRPLEPTPDASFETGLDAFSLHRLGTVGTSNNLRRLLVGGPPPKGVLLHDLPELTLRTTHPIPIEVDGEYLGEHSDPVLFSVPEALAVIA